MIARTLTEIAALCQMHREDARDMVEYLVKTGQVRPGPPTINPASGTVEETWYIPSVQNTLKERGRELFN